MKESAHIGGSSQGRLLLEMPDGTTRPFAVTYHYPENHEFAGLMKTYFWMFEGYMATIQKKKHAWTTTPDEIIDKVNENHEKEVINNGKLE